jgi:hypothetical protein
MKATPESHRDRALASSKTPEKTDTFCAPNTLIPSSLAKPAGVVKQFSRVGDRKFGSFGTIY